MYYHNGRITIDLDQILHHNIVFSPVPESPIIHLISCLILFSMGLITYLYNKLSPRNEELNPQVVICNSWNTPVTVGNFGTGRNTKSGKIPSQKTTCISQPIALFGDFLACQVNEDVTHKTHVLDC